MNSGRLPYRRVHMGIALAPDRLWAAIPGDPLWSCPLEPPAEPDERWETLREAFRQFLSHLGPVSPVLHVALLPPLAQVRWLQLPSLGECQLRRVVARDAGRYFPGLREAQVVAVETRNGKEGRSVLAATVPGRALDALYWAAEEAGCRVAAVVPAYTAWAAAITTLWPEIGRARGALLLTTEGRSEVVHVERGRLAFVRRIPASGCGGPRLLDALAATRREDGSATVVCAGPLRSPLEQLLASEGIVPMEARTDLLDSPGAMAAAFAPRAVGPEFVRESEYENRRRRTGRTALALAAVACILLVAAAGLELWGAHRELDAVVTRREMIRESVGEVMAVREAIDALNHRLSSIAELERDAPHWSDVVARVAERLPRDAHLTAVRGSADTLVLEGAAGRAGGVISAMQRVPGLADVRTRAPIRRETREGAAAVDRFSLIARTTPGPFQEVQK